MAGNRKGKTLSNQDQHLWSEVKKTVVPLDEAKKLLKADFDSHMAGYGRSENKKKAAHTSPQPIPEKPAAPAQKIILKPYAPERPGQTYRPKGHVPDPSLDEQTWRKIGKGRTHIDRKVDLHGMTQIQAHSRLFSVLEEAYRFDQRIVLVVTGKGREGQGILREAVPRWLQEPMFRAITSGSREAHIGHGGGGALYVRVRRKKS